LILGSKQNLYDFLTLAFVLFSKAVSMFENDERFKAVERTRDREDLFESYMVELERKVRNCHFICSCNKCEWGLPYLILDLYS
jgi:hypothetical protein